MPTATSQCHRGGLRDVETCQSPDVHAKLGDTVPACGALAAPEVAGEPEPEIAAQQQEQ